MNQLYEKYVGLVFDNRYQIEKIIGIGGMAIVFKATDLLMRRTVAVKILKDEIASDEQSVKRFTNECRAVAMLSHPNIVDIYDISVRANVKYIVMEFVEGITLKNYMQHREVLNLREIISYTTQILRALEHAHKKGIVHRDIKPQNIMLLRNGIIKVMDFGIAKLPNAETISMADKAIGTVYYISPEQVKGKEDIDARSDIYSLGAMMYEMATGQLPFTADTPVSVALKQVNEAPKPPRELNPYIPVGLEQIILRAMEKAPEDRYQSATEMLEQLQKLRDNPKIIFKENKPKTTRSAGDKGEKKPARKSSRTMFPIIAGVTLAFLITAGVAGYYMLDKLFFNSTMKNYINITVEEFVDHTYTEELKDWFSSSEYYEEPTIRYVYSDTVEKGRISDQDPAPGEIRKVLPGKQKCKVTLDISQGTRTIVLQDYTVRDNRIVESELRRLGLKVEKKSVASDSIEIGYVAGMSPEPGTIVEEDDVITLFVSEGSDQAKVTVPTFVGLNEAMAMIRLKENKLSVGSVTYVKSAAWAGTVLTQSPEPQSQVSLYSKVNFTVSGGANYQGDGYSLPTENDMKEEEETTAPEPIEDETDDMDWDETDEWDDSDETEWDESDESDETYETETETERTRDPNAPSKPNPKLTDPEDTEPEEPDEPDYTEEPGDGDEEDDTPDWMDVDPISGDEDEDDSWFY